MRELGNVPWGYDTRPREGRLEAFPGDFEVDGFDPLKLLLLKVGLEAGRLLDGLTPE